MNANREYSNLFKYDQKARFFIRMIINRTNFKFTFIYSDLWFLSPLAGARSRTEHSGESGTAEKAVVGDIQLFRQRLFHKKRKSVCDNVNWHCG